ncbi:MAG: aminoglycoside phosphotransferase family protein [Salinibacterium sp.]|nr:aminoglycoside phosphotransferase family protein [Salinibacterium sp.]
MEVLAAVAASVGASLESSRVIRVEAAGETFTTGHEVGFRMPEGSLEHHTVFLDGKGLDRPGVLSMRSDDGEQLAAWIYPADPELPALSAAVHTHSAAILLGRFGLDADALSLQVLSYRPGKRAVIRLRTATRTLYFKVVRPRLVNALVATHAQWLAAGIRVPSVIAWSPDGLIALDELPGTEASALIESGILSKSSRFLDELTSLRNRIATIPSAGDARASLASRLRWYGRRLTQLVPTEPQRVTELTRGIQSMLDAAACTSTRATIHGDLHLGQLFVDSAESGRIVGVLDIDTAGLGDPADDAAALWAHLIASAALFDRGGADKCGADRGGAGQGGAGRGSAGRAGTDRASPERANANQAGANARVLAELFRSTWGDGSQAALDPARRQRTAAIAATHLIGHALSGIMSPAASLEAAEALVRDEKVLTSL